ncbi:MAG: threonine--tRNA ligase [Candidatus Thermoplasmatota archaeon]|nr:threonine--tRNA ligase [Candidatus Thermoplasmatota archaeon]
MRLLLLHSDYLEYEAKQAIKNLAEEIQADKKHGKMDETIIAFMTVEKGDDNVDAVATNAVATIKEMAEKVHVKNVVVYPYAHLSSNLAAPDLAKLVPIEIEKKLQAEGFTVLRSPFGWYKSFKLSCKGHPLSELSRTITAESAEKKVTREDVVANITSDFYVLTQDAREYSIDLEKLKKEKDLSEFEQFPELRAFMAAEELGASAGKEPPSIDAMRRLELIDYEPASDPGHFRMYPKGTMIFKQLCDWAEWIATEKLGAVQIETPILYDWSLPDIKGQGKSFHERHYMVQTPDDKREFVLRFAGDFGLFRMIKDATMSYKHLPLRVYEFSKSFRYEQRGELSGLRRLRGFHMPDIHSFCTDINQGWDEYQTLFRNYTDLANAAGIQYAIVFRVVRAFYDKYKDKIVELLKYAGKPAFIEVLSGMKHYWAVKHEFQALDAVQGSCQLSTVQLDVEDAERYGIMYRDADGQQKGCIICHSSIGSIERWIYAILENALKSDKPTLPLWLMPTQVRIIPVSEKYTEDAKKLAEQLGEGIRVDIDERSDTLGKRIRDAEREWIQYIVVFGEKEKESGNLQVRTRDGQRMMRAEEIAKEVKEKTKGYPYQRLPMPQMVSKRVIFRG